MNTIIFFSWQHLWSMKNKAGAPSYHHTIEHYIKSPDWDVHLFTADSSNKELEINNEGKVHIYTANKIVEEISKIKKINHLALPIKHRSYTRWAVNKASKIIESAEHNVIAYGYEVWGVEAAKEIAQKYKIPVVTRFQGTILSYEKHSIINRMIHYPHYGALETKSDLVIMTDDGTMGDDTLKSLGNDSPTLFLRNGLDLYEKYELIHQENDINKLKGSLHINENERILLMASRLTSWKRVDRGLKALSKVLNNRKDVRLIIAGDGDSRKSLESLSEELNIQKNVTFLGSIPQTDLYKYMLCADIFLSLYDLGNLGNPTFEAMLMKKAIIALNGGATSTVLHNDYNSILLEYSEEERIPEYIEKLLIDDEYRNRLAKGAYDFAVKNFYSWGTRMKMEEDAVRRLI